MTTALDRSWREKLIDVREPRRMATPLEMRTDAASGNLILEGYAATFQQYDCYGGIDNGGWIEQIDSRAFDITLDNRPDVQLLVNHEGWPLARTKSGTLELSVDSHGLKVRAMLDKSDPDVQRLLPKMTRGDMDEMSFAFRVISHDWNNDYTQRTIREINLQKGDVSVVNYGMNPTTSAALSDAVDALAALSSRELVELRSLDAGQLDKALHALESVRTAGTQQKRAKTDKTDKPADKKVDHHGVVRTTDGAEVLVAYMTDGTIEPVTFGQPIGPLPIAYSTSPTARGWSGATTGSDSPLPADAADPHNFPGYTKDQIDYDRNLSVDHEVDPAGGAGQLVPTASGYDPHDQAFGTVHTYGAKDQTMDVRDQNCDEDMSRDDCEDEDRDDGEEAAQPVSGFDRTLAAALESTIVSCYELAENSGDAGKDIRTLLARARRQIRDLQGNTPPGENIDINRKLNELRGEFGDPETISVTDGLRALQQAGYADMMHENVTERRKNAADPFPT